MTPGEYKNGGANLRIVWRYAASPFGMVLIAATDKGICHMVFADNPDAALKNLRADTRMRSCMRASTLFTSRR